MLDVSRIRTGQMSFHFGPVHLTDLVRDVLNRYANQVSAAGVQIEAQVDEELVGNFDKVRIEQVLANLILNCIKYAPGSNVKVEARAVGPSIQIRIQDFGPGIPFEKQGMIFDRFERGGTQSGATGLGLGLYICKRIVEAHSGSIQVESELGKGPTFIVDLPARPKIPQSKEKKNKQAF